MASPFIFTESGDLYGPPGVTANVSTQWTTVFGSSPIVVAGLSAPGYALRLVQSTNSIKNFNASFTRIAGSVRFQNTMVAQNYISFLNGVTQVFTITFEISGAINLRTGAVGGASIATAGAVPANSTHVLSWDVTIGGAGVGTYVVNLDGVLLYSGTGNTGNSQPSVNGIQTFIPGNSGNNFTIDDLIIADPTQPNYNSAFLTSNPVIETQYVSGDNQTQFTNDGDVLPPNEFLGLTLVNDPASNVANSLYLARVTAPSNCNLNSIALVPSTAGATAKYKAVLYADSASAPGALLATGTEVVGAVAGTPIDIGQIKTPAYIQAGREDHIAPPQSVWKIMSHFAGPRRFVLAGSGHIAGVVNPPTAQKYQYWINDKPGETLESFIDGAAEHKGSWWPHWLAWLKQQDPATVPAKGARVPGMGKLKAIEDAPGRYVKAR